MTKAFDLLSHDILLHKLSTLGIKDKPWRWIATYLKNRTQTVNIRHLGQDGMTKCYRSFISPPIRTGVPQGSNLGPVLFLLYINDMPDIISTGKVWLFADDISHLIQEKNMKSLYVRAQEGLNNVSEWCQSNSLLLNRMKTRALQFYNRNKPDSTPLLRLKGSSVKVDENIKYLGVTISNNLKWQPHIDLISKRLTAVCYMMSRLRTLLDTEILMKVYYGCFQSVMKYGIIF